MKHLTYSILFTLVACTTTQGPTQTRSYNSTDPISLLTSSMKKNDGFFPFYYDEESGRLFIEVDKVNEEFLYVNSLAAGVGSNDIGLDRGQLDQERIVKFEKHGNKLLLTQPNYSYRAVSDNIEEVRSVSEAFASSVLCGFEIKAKSTKAYLIDITDFLLRDSHSISSRLKQSEQGNYSVDKKRSAIYQKGTFNFPKNSEFEAILTFFGNASGDWIKSVAPSPNAITVRTHHSFIELPDDNYTPRVFDPRCGFFNISYQDYATPIEEPLTKRFIVRHRLRKKEPNAEKSEAVEPIIYYVDRGAPEPIRSALIEGASWWNQAFEAAGYVNAFQVKVLPEGVHPLDIRYNVIQWVHRSTRGWSYGSGVTDPRTGEMIKGHVSLGSLRVRQDFLIATGLLQPYVNGNENPTEMTQMALARLRQLSAHEVGHTLGLAHNFAASTNDRASVMDYPHPYVKMDQGGNIDLSDAYDDKIGAWDKISIAYGYSNFPTEEDQNKLQKILNDAFSSGLKYITDQDARPAGGAHVQAHLWDNGTKASDELNRMMKIRRKILNDFSEKVIKNGTPMSSIEEVLVPMYLFHRYQIDAVSKTIGGIEYAYDVRGNEEPMKLFAKEDQLESLDAMLSTVSVPNLKLPESLLNKISPRAFGYPRSRETFQSKTGPAFDYLAAVETAASLPFEFLFNADRANRLVTFHARRPDSQPGLKLVLDKTVKRIWMAPSTNRLGRTIQKVVETEMLRNLMALAVNENAYTEVKSQCLAAIMSISTYAKSRINRTTNEDGDYYKYVVNHIDYFLENPHEFKIEAPIKVPDGSPIGSCDL